MGVFVFVGRSFADTVRVVSVEANVRLQMDPASTVVAVVKAGTVLPIERRDGNWYRVRLPAEQGLERVGYIQASDVEVDPIASTDPPKSLSPGPTASSGKPVMTVHLFTAAPGVELPYDLKQLQAQLVADLKVQLGKEFDVIEPTSAGAGGGVFAIDGEITGWNPGNAAKRIIIGLGSGRESTDLRFRVTNSSGQNVLDRVETIRTNFYSQGAGSIGTLAHPIAQKIAERVRDAKLR